jgi:tetratricopeptide (TPR) repeat protein
MEDYTKALVFYEKDLEISLKTLSPNNPELAISYNNIAGIYFKTREYTKALSYYEHANKILNSSQSPNPKYLRVVRNSIELVKTKLQTTLDK